VVVFVVLGWSEAGLRRYNDLFRKVRAWRKDRGQQERDSQWMELMAAEREEQMRGKRKRKIIEVDANSAYNCVLCDTGSYSEDEDERSSAPSHVTVLSDSAGSSVATVGTPMPM
jgi:predicted nucleic-acid-binding Zn-ribbon protein